MLSYFEKLFYENALFPSLVYLYSNLEDKVLIEDGSIVMNQRLPDRNLDITKDQLLGQKGLFGMRPISN